MSARKKKPRRPSGPSGKNHGVPLMIRASSLEQKERWQAAAERARRNLSDWIRVTLDDAAAAQNEANRPVPKD